ncbi:archaetidylserine decarboxylase [Roseateles oligotrophus]|uniref:phosphatidylserine decarboxylase n=1 Tax=Roseateles oligotrophus TaxID=1769250 RepID=A0ABT2YEA4_9BURK|nr:archaetidylserine decarboxylase [Roseateles oligotrophus]MCV2368385.1 archaetidylserine decarboxylase [Roseateles oligotrophus]
MLQQEDLNFLLTNRIPRIALTRLMGKFSQIRHPLLARASIAIWRLFTDLDLSDAKKQKFDSLHDCFTRELVAGARRVDMATEVLSSPCDAIVGACGQVEGRQIFQAKGFPYSMQDLFGPTQDTSAFQDGMFVTLRLTSAMYHRFHAPQDCTVEHVTHIAGDTWNVNPIALKRVERLFCRNERAVLRSRLKTGEQIAIVPVAAILVASLRLHFLDLLLHVDYQGANELPCRASFKKGEEMGWFQHGSTIIVFAPKGFTLSPGIGNGSRIRTGQALMQLPQPS